MELKSGSVPVSSKLSRCLSLKFYVSDLISIRMKLEPDLNLKMVIKAIAFLTEFILRLIEQYVQEKECYLQCCYTRCSIVVAFEPVPSILCWKTRITIIRRSTNCF